MLGACLPFILLAGDIGLGLEVASGFQGTRTLGTAGYRILTGTGTEDDFSTLGGFLGGLAGGYAGARLAPRLKGLVRILADERGSFSLLKIPLGFKDAAEFSRFARALRSGLAEAGLGDAAAFVRGSSVTGKSFTTGEAFDVGRKSDLDLALVSSPLVAQIESLGIRLRAGGTRTPPLSPSVLRRFGLFQLQNELRQISGRKVGFMIYDDIASVEARGPSIEVLSE